MVATKSRANAYADRLYALLQRCCELDGTIIQIGDVRLSPSELDVMLLIVGEIGGIDPLPVESLAEMGLAEIAEKLGRIAAEGGEIRYGEGVCKAVSAAKVRFLAGELGKK